MTVKGETVLTEYKKAHFYDKVVFSPIKSSVEIVCGRKGVLLVTLGHTSSSRNTLEDQNVVFYSFST